MSQTTQPPQSSADTSLIPQNSIPPEDTRKQIERLYKSWPLTPLVSTCIELLRFQNAGWGCSDEWSQGDIWLTLKNVFNGSAVYGLSKFDFIDAELIDYHFKNFNMPAWDRLMKRLDKGPGHSTLMFAITCVKGKIPSEVKSKDADGPLKMSDMVNKLGKILPFPFKDFDPKIVEETCTADLDELCRKDGASRKEEKARVRSIWEITGC